MKTFLGAIAYIALVGVILKAGWNDPLCTLFMSPAEIVAFKGLSAPVAAATPEPIRTPWPTPQSGKFGHTALDRTRPY